MCIRDSLSTLLRDLYIHLSAVHRGGEAPGGQGARPVGDQCEDCLLYTSWGWLAWVLVIFNFVTQFCVMVAQGRGLRTAVITLSQVGGSEGLRSGASLIITIILFVVIVAAYFLGGSFSFVHKLTSVMLTAMLICFAITFFIALPDIKDIFLGIIPSFPPRWEGLLPDSQQWTSIAGIIGGAAGLYLSLIHISSDRRPPAWGVLRFLYRPDNAPGPQCSPARRR